jgi:DNA-binding beta-propeller fold protein YncE
MDAEIGRGRSNVMCFSRVCLLAFGCIGIVLGQQGNIARLGPNAPTLGYKEVLEWPVPLANAAGTPAPWNFIQVSGVAVDSRGRILVLHRGAQPLLEFESNGKFVRSWDGVKFSEGKVAAIAQADRIPGKSGYSAVYGPAGCDSCGAHSVRMDREHNIWVADAPGQVIYKLDPAGKLLLQLGQKGTAGTGHNTFNLPTDVGFAPNGDFYVTDGYANARVVKFSHDGKYLLEWGSRGSGPGQFELPHNVVVDEQGNVYVTDRENRRIEVFDSNGKFLRQWPTVEGVSGLFITKDQRLWAGGVLLDLQGQVIARLPGANAAGGHGVAVSDTGDVYLAQLSGKVQKYSK